MKKIRLELDALQVQTYETTPAGAHAKGTIQGAEITGVEKTACSIDCSFCLTCQQCGNSDLGTCPPEYSCGASICFTCDACATTLQTCNCSQF